MDTVDVPLAHFSELTIRGRRFLVKEVSTFRQDVYAMKLMADSGVDALLASATPGTMSVQDLTERVVIQAFENNVLFKLLAAVLVEEGKPLWTLEDASANEQLFSEVEDPLEKAALNGGIVAILLSFFVKGLASGRLSQSFFLGLDGATPPPAPASEPIEDSTTSASGATLSELLPISTQSL